jgi:hypothetical protein
MVARPDILAITEERAETPVRIGLTPLPGTALVIAEVDEAPRPPDPGETRGSD